MDLLGDFGDVAKGTAALREQREVLELRFWVGILEKLGWVGILEKLGTPTTSIFEGQPPKTRPKLQGHLGCREEYS